MGNLKGNEGSLINSRCLYILFLCMLFELVRRREKGIEHARHFVSINSGAALSQYQRKTFTRKMLG